MVAYRLIFLAGMAAALPLNINLGAYSPALVVGDGEISFGAAANGAAQAQAPAAAPAAAAPPAAAAAAAAVPAAPAVPAAAAAEGAAVADPALAEQAQQIAALQGMGKTVAPRAEDSTSEGGLTKRQSDGFDRALKFAEAALVKGPKVQLGTGEGGAGVGIIVDNNQEAAARAGTGAVAEGAALPAAAAPAAAVAPAGLRTKKRDLSSPRLKVTTMYVRSGIPSSLQNGGKLTARDVYDIPTNHAAAVAAVSKREASPSTSSSSSALDAVNLNVDGDQGITMTFVETVEDDDQE